ncbi:hypothetical protein [Pseudomonas phage vB_PaS-HSN4]|nr:hypothetical protein [Pseudomonas phage vB_PaS-HSN4]
MAQQAIDLMDVVVEVGGTVSDALEILLDCLTEAASHLFRHSTSDLHREDFAGRQHPEDQGPLPWQTRQDRAITGIAQGDEPNME